MSRNWNRNEINVTRHKSETITQRIIDGLELESQVNDTTATKRQLSKRKSKLRKRRPFPSAKSLLDLLVTSFTHVLFKLYDYPLSLNVIIIQYLGHDFLHFISFNLCPEIHQKTLCRFGTVIQRKKCKTKTKICHDTYRRTKSKFMCCASKGYGSGTVEWQIKCHQASPLDSIGVISDISICQNDRVVLKWIDDTIHRYSIGIWEANDVITIRLEFGEMISSVTFKINDKQCEKFNIVPHHVYYPFIHSQEDRTKYTVTVCNENCLFSV
eukprot:104037_1